MTYKPGSSWARIKVLEERLDDLEQKDREGWQVDIRLTIISVGAFVIAVVGFFT